MRGGQKTGAVATNAGRLAAIRRQESQARAGLSGGSRSRYAGAALPRKERPVAPEVSNSPGFLPQLRLDELLSELQGLLQAVLGTRDQMRGLLEAVIAISSRLDLESTRRRVGG